MFDPVTEAAAQSLGEHVGLGPYPILQLFGGIIALIALGAGGYLWKRGERDSKNSSSGGGVQVYMDGPLVEALRELKKITTALERLPDVVGDMAKFRDEMNEQARDHRHAMVNRLQEMDINHDKDFNRIDDQVRDVQMKQAAAAEQFRSVFARIENLERERGPRSQR